MNKTQFETALPQQLGARECLQYFEQHPNTSRDYAYYWDLRMKKRDIKFQLGLAMEKSGIVQIMEI